MDVAGCRNDEKRQECWVIKREFYETVVRAIMDLIVN